MPPHDGPDLATLRERVHHAVCDLVQELGGSISAEHGIGRLKAGELAARKAALDLGGVLNPGVILEASTPS